jgi:hypothetical protein
MSGLTDRLRADALNWTYGRWGTAEGANLLWEMLDVIDAVETYERSMPQSHEEMVAIRELFAAARHFREVAE